MLDFMCLHFTEEQKVHILQELNIVFSFLLQHML